MRDGLGMGVLHGCGEEGEVGGEAREARERVWGDHPAGARCDAGGRPDGLCSCGEELDVALSREERQQCAVSGGVPFVRLQRERALVEERLCRQTSLQNMVAVAGMDLGLFGRQQVFGAARGLSPSLAWCRIASCHLQVLHF